MALDSRSLSGIDIWIKPLKFEVALAIYTLTLAWYAGWLPSGVTGTRWYLVFSATVVFCIAAEMVWIGGAAAHGVASHFNLSTPAMSFIYGLMGIFPVILTSASLLYGALILRSGKLNPVFRLSAGLGLILTFALTVVAAGYMASATSHFVGGAGSDAEGMALMGWARDGGDLRVAHFFATHALHVIPAFGYAASRILSRRSGYAAVAVFSAFYVVFVAYTFGEALLGLPFLAMIG
ncbi:MAG: hypothetical protein HC850_06675 [Rhodomicrobium sp.]|nr:hypothetical protein [Rhodomicrobium sp.]